VMGMVKMATCVQPMLLIVSQGQFRLRFNTPTTIY
jgi:hypothetical protein